MQICIRRGANTIGGSAVELTANTGERIIIDLGQPLDAEKCTPDLLPDIPGLVTKTDDLLGILISHPHQDHYGLCMHIDKQIPIFMGAATMAIMNAMVEFGIGNPILFVSQNTKMCPQYTKHIAAGKPTFFGVHNFQAGKTFNVGPFQITPYLMDHSAYDAYAFVIECDGKRVLYSGDFRAHGRKGDAFAEFISNPPKDIDVLLMEGSCLGRESCAEYESEVALEQHFADVFNKTPGLCMILSSSQNIDRIITISNACVQSGRTLAISSYTGRILMCIRDDNVPTFKNGRAKRLDTTKVASHYVTYEEIQPAPDKYVVFLIHKSFEALKKTDLINPNAALIYSMWGGYKEKESMAPKLDYVKSCGITPIDIHTSGHADIPTLQKFATVVGARRLVPIHTFYPDEFNRLFENVEPHANNEPFNV